MTEVAGASEPTLAIDENVLVALWVYDDRNKHAFQIDGVSKPIQFVLGEI